MKVDYNLEQLLELAFICSPHEAEYLAMKILASMPMDVMVKPFIKGNSEYIEDEQAIYEENEERIKFSNLISKLRIR